MDPFDELTQEHRAIEMVLDALEVAAGRTVAPDFYGRAITFLAEFADGVHHAKEEQRLFIYLEKRGMPRDYGPLSVMCEEHDSGRRHIEAMRAALEDADPEALRRESLAYVELMRDHIGKEDDILFPMGRALLTPEEIEHVAGTFTKVPPPPQPYEQYLRLAESLLAEVGVPA